MQSEPEKTPPIAVFVRVRPLTAAEGGAAQLEGLALSSSSAPADSANRVLAWQRPRLRPHVFFLRDIVAWIG